MLNLIDPNNLAVAQIAKLVARSADREQGKADDSDVLYGVHKRVKASRRRVGATPKRYDGSVGKSNCGRSKDQKTALSTVQSRDRWEMLFNKSA